MLHEQAPREWAEMHFGGVEMSDVRRVDRVVTVAEAVAEAPGKSLPQLFARPYDVKAAYGLLAHPEATPEVLQAGHREVVREALRQPGTFVLLEDTSDVVLSGRAKIAGLGPIGNGSERLQGFLLHTVIAVGWRDEAPVEGKRPGVEILGVPHQEYHVRQPRPKDEHWKASKQRARESQLWERATESLGAPPETPDTTWIRVCDRGADIYEFLLSCQRAGHGYVVRVAQNRRLVDPATGGLAGYLIETARSAPPLGTTTLELRTRPGQPRRTATLSLAATPVVIGAPRRTGIRPADQPPITAWAVRVWEADPPAGVAPLEWILLTDQPVTSLADAVRVMRLYVTRWLCEEFHKALKTGLGIERLQLETAHRLWAAVAILSIVAMRLLDLRELARLFPEAPARVAGLTSLELDVLRLKHPHPIDTVRDVVLAIGRLGGHLNRTRDGLPGWQSLWRGWIKLRDLVEGVALAHTLNKFG
jgi:hypothetical protein